MTSQNAASAREAARRPAGSGAGGQFGAQERDEADLGSIDLTGDYDEGQYEHGPVFEQTVHATYWRNEIPKGCRNPRPVQHTVNLVSTVMVVTDSEAPVAIEIEQGTSRDHYRTFGGNLYEPVFTRVSGQPREPVLAGDAAFPAETTTNLGDCPDGVTEASIRVQEAANDFLVVDEQVYQRCGEPRYVVQTFGLGGNHASTGLFTATSDNPNIAADAYFRADDFEAARDYAVRVAEERGDTDSVPGLRKMTPPITVHDPSALRLVCAPHETPEVRELRSAYRDRARAYEQVLRDADTVTVAEEHAAWEALVAARANLNHHTGDVHGHGSHRRPFEEGRKPLW